MAVAPLGGDGGGDGVITVGAEQLGRQKAAEAAFDEVFHADGGGFGGVLEADVFPRGVANERIGDARENAHHARIDFGAARGGADGHRRHAGDVGVEVGEEFVVDVGKHHTKLAAAPLEGGLGGVFDDIAAARPAGGIGPWFGRQAHIKIEGLGGGGRIEDGAPAVFLFVEGKSFAARAPEEGHPQERLVLAAREAEGVDAPGGIGEFPAGLIEILPGPAGPGRRDAGGIEEVAAVEDDAAKGRPAGHGPDVHRAVGPGPADDGFDLRVDPAGDFLRGQGGEIAVFREVEGAEEALGDVGVGLAEVDVEHVGGDVAGDGQQRAFDAFDLDAGEAVEAESEGGEIKRAVARGVGGLAGAEEVRGGAEEFALDGEFGAGGGIGAGGVGEVEERQVEDEVGRRRLEPARSGGERN